MNEVRLIGKVLSKGEVVNHKTGKMIILRLRSHDCIFKVQAWDRVCKYVEEQVDILDTVWISGYVHFAKSKDGTNEWWVKAKDCAVSEPRLKFRGEITNISNTRDKRKNFTNIAFCVKMTEEKSTPSTVTWCIVPREYEKLIKKGSKVELIGSFEFNQDHIQMKVKTMKELS